MNARTRDRFYAAIDTQGEVRIHQASGNRCEVAGMMRTMGLRLVLGPASSHESIQRQVNDYRQTHQQQKEINHV